MGLGVSSRTVYAYSLARMIMAPKSFIISPVVSVDSGTNRECGVHINGTNTIQCSWIVDRVLNKTASTNSTPERIELVV